MDCQRFEEIVHELARGGMENASLLRDGLEHTETCPSCGELLAEARALQQSLASLAQHDRGASAPFELESTLFEQFRRSHQKTAPPPRRLPRWAIPAAGLAAAAGSVVFLWFGHSGRRPADNHAAIEPVGVSVSGATSPNSDRATTRPRETVRKAAGVRPYSPHPRHVHASSHARPAPPDTLAGFVMLPYADDPSTIDRGVIVRVLMPPSALVWLGLPPGNNQDGAVADLFLSGSGVPEAIRFVR